jgi:D-alanine-D-alanine ligase
MSEHSGPTRKPRVAIVFGGRSSEHAISCVTAGSVLEAIDRAAYDVVPIGIAPDGRWVLESGDTERLQIKGPDHLPSVDGDRAAIALLREAGSTDLVVHEPSQPPETLGEVDVVFPLLHGPWGEDGTIQGMFEMAGVRYVGAGVLASAVGMDKAYAKIVLRAAGLPVMPSVTVTAREWYRDPDGVRHRVADLGFPLFVKPARAGSSMGISKVHDASELDAAIEEAHRHDPKALVEQAAVGAREVECGVLEALDGTPETSVPAEIIVSGDHEFYDFAAKYLPEEHTELDVPADLPETTAAELRELAVRAFGAIDCEGLARVDFFVMPDGSLVLNEINTMPGFTPTSMYPRMWAATGVDYPALVDRLIQLALRRSTGLR